MRSLTLTLDVPDWAEAYIPVSDGVIWLKTWDEYGARYHKWQDEDGITVVYDDPRVVLLKKEG